MASQSLQHLELMTISQMGLKICQEIAVMEEHSFSKADAIVRLVKMKRGLLLVNPDLANPLEQAEVEKCVKRAIDNLEQEHSRASKYIRDEVALLAKTGIDSEVKSSTSAAVVNGILLSERVAGETQVCDLP